MENQYQKATSVFLQKMEEEDVKLDRISALPDSIIRHILSFLPTSEEAIKTGVLSKRWDSLWASVPNLIFRHHKDGNIQDFFNFIDKTLILYSSSKIKKFVVDFGYHEADDSFNSRIGLWLRFALRRDVDELCLEFWKSQDEKSKAIYYYTLPHYFYNNPKLVKLKSRFCDYMAKGKVNWNSLKSLSITYAEFSDDDVVNKILQGSPVLECLELHKCSGLDNLDIASKSLKKLVINGIWKLGAQENVSMIEISAPNLQFLEILGNWKCRLMNVSSLVSVSLKFELTVDKEESNDFTGEYGNMLTELLEKVGHVNELTLGTWCIQVLSISMSEGKLLSIRSSNHKYLILDTHFDEWDIHGLASLLLSSPKLEKLVIDMTSNIDKKFDMDPILYNSYRFEEKYWTSKKLIFKYLLQHLKTIEIVVPEARNYWNEHLFQFLQFLLGNAEVLEKMVITDNCTRDQRKHELYEVAKKLLSFPRSSPHAVILLP